MGEVVKYQRPEEVIELVKTDFMTMADKLNFQKEMNYAIQMITKTEYSLECFKKNPMSLKFAMLNLAGIGLSLNPATRFAYLIPRDGAIVLDISYMGLLELAIRDGGILWGQANVSRQHDTFSLFGFDQPPEHKYDPFAPDKDRGEMKGAYCVVKTQDGSYLTTTMNKDAIEKIMKRSTSYIAHIKKGVSTAWINDPEEMWKKTVIKRGYKTWPKGRTNYLAKAIDYLNKHEGIDFDEEKKIKVVDENANTLDAALTKQNEEIDLEKAKLVNEILEKSGALCAKFNDKEKISFMTTTLGIKKKTDKVQDKSLSELKEIMKKLVELEKKKEPINAESKEVDEYNKLVAGMKIK